MKEAIAYVIVILLVWFFGFMAGLNHERNRKNKIYQNVHRVLEDASFKGEDSVSVKEIWDTMYVKSEF